MAKTKACKCIDDVQEQLKERGVTLTRSFMLDFKTGKSSMSPPQLQLHKLATAPKRAKLPTIICAHCPFCGKKYPV